MTEAEAAAETDILLISGCPGALNIADDLNVHGKDQATHLPQPRSRPGASAAARLDAELEEMLVPPRRHQVLRPPTLFKGCATNIRENSSDHRSTSTDQRIGPAKFTVGFSSRFIPDFSTTAEPQRRLTHKGTRSSGQTPTSVRSTVYDNSSETQPTTRMRRRRSSPTQAPLDSVQSSSRSRTYNVVPSATPATPSLPSSAATARRRKKPSPWYAAANASTNFSTAWTSSL